MMFDRQKLWLKLRFARFRRNPVARNDVRSPKTNVKLRFARVRRNPFARNDVRSPKTNVKLRFARVRRNPFARNEVRSPKTDLYHQTTIKFWSFWFSARFGKYW